MAELKIDPQRAVEIEIKAESPAVFRFIAQFREPDKDYVDFASTKESTHLSKSTYLVELHSPIKPYTDLRIYFLIDGPANHPYRIAIQCSQGSLPLGHPIICEGAIGQDGKIIFVTAEATFI